MYKKGITIIVLVITIIVIIILVGSVIMNLSNNNVAGEANKAKFLSDIGTFRTELSTYILNQSVKTLGDYNQKLLYADKISVKENNEEDFSRNITNVITSMKKTRYKDIFEIIEGELKYIGDNDQEIEWLNEIL